MNAEWKPAFLNAKKKNVKNTYYSMCKGFLLNFAPNRAVYFNCWKDAVQKKFPFRFLLWSSNLTGF